MKFFKALFGSIFELLNDLFLDKNIKKAKKEAYNATGIKIVKAKRQGKFIDGSAEYKRNFNARKNKATRNHKFAKSFSDRFF